MQIGSLPIQLQEIALIEDLLFIAEVSFVGLSLEHFEINPEKKVSDDMAYHDGVDKRTRCQCLIEKSHYGPTHQLVWPLQLRN